MASLICDPRPEAAAQTSGYQHLREAGEPLTLFWPQVSADGEWGGCLRLVADAVAWEAALEDEVIPCIAGLATLPNWLPVAEMDRILMVSAAAAISGLAPGERALAESLLAAGEEEVELVPPAALAELGQSWHSGRRAATLRFTPDQR